MSARIRKVSHRPRPRGAIRAPCAAAAPCSPRRSAGRWLLLALLLLALLPCLLPLRAAAVDAEELQAEQGRLFGISALEAAGNEHLEQVEVNQEMDVNAALKSILERGRESAKGVLKQAVKSCLLLLSIVLLFGLAQSVGETSGGGSLSALHLAAAAAVTAVAVGDMFAMVGMGRTSMEQMQVFSKVLLPSMAAATAAAGAPGAAAAKQLATILFSDFLITVINQFLLPLTFAYIAACVAFSALGNGGIKRIGNCLKWIVNTTLGVLLLAFVGYLNASGAIAGSADVVTVKAAKFTVSNMVPVVGSILSDATETVLAGASLLRSAIGVFGMLTILAICLLPFLQLGAQYLGYKITAALAATVADNRTADLIESIGSAFGMVLAMTASCALLLLIALVSAVSMVTV